MNHFKSATDGAWRTIRLSAYGMAIAALTSSFNPILAQQPLQGLFADDMPTSSSVVLPEPPRQLRRELEEAQRALQEKRFSEAVESLDRILNLEDAEDFFLDDSTDGKYNSVKRQAQHLLGSMPPAGREIYELESGSDARSALETAIDKGDIGGITEVSRRYFHTSAGYEATMLLARFEADSGRPLAAALQLERLAESSAARQRLGSELPLQRAICWSMAGFDDKAIDALLNAPPPHRMAGQSVVIAGRSEVIPTGREDVVAWLKRVSGGEIAMRTGNKLDWTMFRVDPQRSAAMAGGMPLPKLEWFVEPTVNESERTALLATYESFISNEIAAIPVMQPLAVGNELLMRTGRMLFGVNLKSGKCVWPYPDEELPLDPPAETGVPQQRDNLLRQDTQQFVQQRFWQDSPFAQLSSDGERLFLLRDIEPVTTQAIRNFGGMNMQPAEVTFNRLVALELSSQGKTLWTAEP